MFLIKVLRSEPHVYEDMVNIFKYKKKRVFSFSFREKNMKLNEMWRSSFSLLLVTGLGPMAPGTPPPQDSLLST